MEIMIDLTDAELDEVVGGSGFAYFNFTQSAHGGHINQVTGTLTQNTTPTSANQSGTFASYAA